MSIKEVIDDLKKQGFKVYGPDPLTTYVWFTDNGKRVGYAQYSRFEGALYSTVHKPCQQCGTGFMVSTARKALCHVPEWAAAADVNAVRKYDSMEEFIKSYWQPLVQY